MVVVGSLIIVFVLGFGLGHLNGRRAQRSEVIGERGRQIVLPPELSRRS